jgi:hypothetical protein
MRTIVNLGALVRYDLVVEYRRRPLVVKS